MNAFLDVSPLRKAWESLQQAYRFTENKTWFEAQNHTVQETLLAGVIQHFEFVYELSIKMLKRQLEQDATSVEAIDHSNFRDLLRMGAESGLIADVAHWFDYRQMRNITAHTYDEEKARLVYQGIARFIGDSLHLLTTLEQRNAPQAD